MSIFMNERPCMRGVWCSGLCYESMWKSASQFTIPIRKCKWFGKIQQIKKFEPGTQQLCENAVTKSLWCQKKRYTGVIWATFLNRTPIFDWWIVRWGSKNKHHTYTCLQDIGLRLQIFLTTHSMVNTTNRTWYIVSQGINKHALSKTHN